MNRRSKPRWWQLYILGAVVCGLFVLIHQWRATESLRETAEVAVVLCGFGALQVWFAFNPQALGSSHDDSPAQPSSTQDVLNDQQIAFREVMRRKATRRREELIHPHK